MSQTSTTKKKLSKRALKRTQKILQTAHDYIEVNGFDIQEYGYLGEDGEGPTPRCFIGAVRAAAGVDPEPGGFLRDPAHLDDGPELEIALSVLDGVARRTTHAKDVLPYVEKHLSTNVTHPGRFVEALGLMLDGEEEGQVPIMNGDEQRKFALTLMRRALRDVHKQLEVLQVPVI